MATTINSDREGEGNKELGETGRFFFLTLYTFVKFVIANRHYFYNVKNK